MARSAIPLYTTNQIITAAHGNSYWRDNEVAHWVGVAAGDLGYYTGAANKSRLAIGAAGQGLLVNAGANAPEWGSVATELIAKRQGGHATDWHTAGANNYTPTGSFIQCGITEMDIVGGTSDTNTITLPTAYTNKPLVMISWGDLIAGAVGAGGFSLWINNIAVGSFDIMMSSDTNPTTVTVNVAWLTIGI